MFDGVPDQFHHFITPRTSLPLHLPFPLHASGTFPTNFDPYNHHQLPLQLQPPNNNLISLHPLHHHKDEEKEENSNPMNNFEIQRDQSQQLPQLIDPDPWTNDELLSLLKIRSSMETWFPELTWEHVSRRLAELGYTKRSAEKCKEKFEEETRYFNNNTNTSNNNSNYRFLSELEQLYNQQQGGGDHLDQKTTSQPLLQKQDKTMADSRNNNIDGTAAASVMTTTKQNDEQSVEKTTKVIEGCKRKRPADHRFEVFKGFCESIVHKMIAQQEELHNKLLEDMVKRDEERIIRDEAWKKKEMENMNKELEMMTREQAIAADRQANIIQFLKTFSPPGGKVTNLNTHIVTQNPNNPSQTAAHRNPTLQLIIPSTSSTQNPSSCSLNSYNNNNNPVETNLVLNRALSSNVVSKKEKDSDVGRRWPKDEVLALINLRCTTTVNNNNEENKVGNINKVPLWERISQGMSELGYKRSAKRCKEKWENINKYFRKTKDVNKKRSLDSRTCPYFHQLSSLYNQGKLVLQSDQSHFNNPNPPDENENLDQVMTTPDQTTQAHESSSQVGSAGFSVQQVDDHGGEKTLMQVPSLDFDQF